MLFDYFSKTASPKAKDSEEFPTLLIEPWRVTELLEKESVLQRYRLFRTISLSRITLTILALVLFNLNDTLVFSMATIITCYLLLVSAFFLYIRTNIENVQLYSFFIGLFDVGLLGYLFVNSQSKVELSFLFFSLLLSAMVLPLSRLIMIIFVAYLVITLGWDRFPFDSLKTLFSSLYPFDWQLLKKGLRGFNKQEPMILVGGFFFLAVIVNRLAFWSFANDVRARFRHKQMQQVLAYNRAIVEHLKTGVITLNADSKIISINRRAIDLLNLKTDRPVTDLNSLSKQLAKRYKAWLSEGAEVTGSYRHNANAEEVAISFSRFDASQHLIMMSIESINASFQRANEAKLTALGRLTAGIAHEIRNPLASINTAAQLLNESAANAQQTQLSEMILSNIKRTNQIINDVLSLFKEAQPLRNRLDVKAVLTGFCREFSASHKDNPFSLRVVSPIKTPVYVMFDLGQLSQVLWNLCHNALKYADNPQLVITLVYRLSKNKRMLYIDVIDNGVGIPKEKQAYLFEPFYTGSSSGSGLGLYLVRELCGANNANIAYIPPNNRNSKPDLPNKGACFRLSTQAYFSKKTKPTLRDKA